MTDITDYRLQITESKTVLSGSRLLSEICYLKSISGGNV